MNNWRLSTGLTIFTSKENLTTGDSGINTVYFSPMEKKSYQVMVSKKIPGSYETIDPAQNEVDEVRFVPDSNQELGFRVEIKSSQLPEDDWYWVRNFDNSTLGSIISQLKIEGGKLETATKFEIIFNTRDSSLISLISPEMSEYHDCMTELARRLACDVGKKTKKWIPGHKYELENKTVIYLGSFLSRKANRKDSPFLNVSLPEVILYVSDLLPGETTISDIFKNRPFNNLSDNGINIIYGKCPSGIDAGEVLKGDTPDDIQTCWENLLTNTANLFKSTSLFGRDIYSDISEILNIFTIQSEKNLNYNLSEKVSNDLTEILKVWTWDIIVNSWDKSLGYISINNSKPAKDNLKNLKNLIIFEIKDINSKALNFYEELLLKLNIDLDKICEESYNKWISMLPKLTSDFDCYLSNIENFRPISYGYGIGDNIELERFYNLNFNLDDKTGKQSFTNMSAKYPELFSKIEELMNYSVANFGDKVTKFNTYKVGTVRSPQQYINVIVITLKDILNYINLELELTETLKHEIMSMRFIGTHIQIEKV